MKKVYVATYWLQSDMEEEGRRGFGRLIDEAYAAIAAVGFHRDRVIARAKRVVLKEVVDGEADATTMPGGLDRASLVEFDPIIYEMADVRSLPDVPYRFWELTGTLDGEPVAAIIIKEQEFTE